jgi:hypothetical protein
VDVALIVLRLRIARHRHNVEQAHRLPDIAGHAQAVEVKDGEVVLRFCVALVGGEPVPARRLGAVRGDAEAVVEHHPEVELGDRVTALGFRAEMGERGLVVAGLERRHAFVEVG